MIDHAQLLLLMGVAGGGLLIHRGWLNEHRRHAVTAGLVWYATCLLPLVHLQNRVDALFPFGDSHDYAGAAALHVSMAGVIWLSSPRDLRRRNGASSSLLADPTNLGALAAIGLLVLAWASWLVAIEGRLSSYAMDIALTCVALGALGALAATGTALLRRRSLASVSIAGAVAGLAAASAAASSLSLLGAVPVAVSVGILAAVVLPRHGNALSVDAILAAAGIGGATGLIAVGLLDERGGFFYTGQPTLLIAQVSLVVIAGAWAVVVGSVLFAIRQLAHKDRTTE